MTERVGDWKEQRRGEQRDQQRNDHEPKLDADPPDERNSSRD